jgi:hypothetical protein
LAIVFVLEFGEIEKSLEIPRNAESQSAQSRGNAPTEKLPAIAEG